VIFAGPETVARAGVVIVVAFEDTDWDVELAL
jgi:hypothetical protein